MVGWLVASVEPHESADRRSVRQAHDVGRNEAKRVHVPAHAPVEVRSFEHEVAELGDLRRLERGPLGVVHAHDLARSVVQDRAPGRKRLGRRNPMQNVDLDSFRIDETHDRAAAWARRPLYRTAERLGQSLNVVCAWNRQA